MKNNERATALIAAVTFIGVVAVISMVLLSSLRLSGKVRLDHWLAAEAMSAAQSGLAEAMVELDSGKTFTSLKGKMGNANYEVVWMETADGPRLLRATGIAEKKGRLVRKVIEIEY